MAGFLSLPTEIRYQIYRGLLSHRRIEQKNSCSTFTYQTFGKCPAILLVNRQTNQEAMRVIYGDHTWVLYASSRGPPLFGPLQFAQEYIRKIIISFKLYDRLFLLSSRQGTDIHLRSFVGMICSFLANAPALKHVELRWEEDSDTLYKNPFRGPESCVWPLCPVKTPKTHVWDHVNQVQDAVTKVLTPISQLPMSCTIRKGPISVTNCKDLCIWPMELGFSNVVDAVIALRQDA